MNQYSYRFVSTCPGNQESIVYDLCIQTSEKIPVEQIKTACAKHKSGYHEDIADELSQGFGGHQELSAMHHGVHIITVRCEE